MTFSKHDVYRQCIPLVSARLRHFKRANGDGYKWRAACPACPKKNLDHLSVFIDDTPKTVVHCFTGCGTQAVLDALGLKFKDLYPHSDESISHEDRDRWKRAKYREKILLTMRHEMYIMLQTVEMHLNGTELTPFEKDREQQAMLRLIGALGRLYEQSK